VTRTPATRSGRRPVTNITAGIPLWTQGRQTRCENRSSRASARPKRSDPADAPQWRASPRGHIGTHPPTPRCRLQRAGRRRSRWRRKRLVIDDEERVDSCRRCNWSLPKGRGTLVAAADSGMHTFTARPLSSINSNLCRPAVEAVSKRVLVFESPMPEPRSLDSLDKPGPVSRTCRCRNPCSRQARIVRLPFAASGAMPC